MKKAIFVVFFIVFNYCQAADFNLTPAYNNAYMEVLRLRFDNASRLINIEKQTHPYNLSYVYLFSYIDFLKALISEGKEEHLIFINNKQLRLKLMMSVDQKSPWHLYSQAQINLQSGIIYVKSGDYVKAAVDLKKAYQQFVSNNKLFPDFEPNKAGLGLLYVLIGSIPDSFKWIPGIFNMKGDVNQGMKELHKILVGNSDNVNYPFLFNECLFITSFVTYNLAMSESNKLIFLDVLKDKRVENELSRNPLLIYAIASFYAHQGMNDKALRLLINRPLDISYYNFYYLDYLTGLAKLNNLEKDARTFFLRYIVHFKGNNFKKAAYQRIAWSYLLENNINEYHKNINRIKLLGSEEMEADKEAISEARSGNIPNPELLRARLLFDGGYYVKASQILKEINTIEFSNREFVEYSYRQARIQHKLGNLSKAKALYHDTYRKGRSLPNYFAANSMLNLGNIYEQEGNKQQAVLCYRLSLQLGFKDYRNSIQQKAKAGLNRLSSE